MRVLPVSDLSDPRVAPFRNLKDAALQRELGLFIVEGHRGVRRLLAGARFEAHSLFLSESMSAQMAPELAPLSERVPVYVAPQALLDRITGFHIHRGCLAAAWRGSPHEVADLIAPGAETSLVVVLEGLANHDNVGGVFRNAMAFGADAVLLCPRCCDPLYRKAVRVSMGGVLRVPFARIPRWPEELGELRARGYTLVAMDPSGDPPSSAGLPARAALLLGTEGEGLSAPARAATDLRLRIPMAEGVDSLNVATAGGIAMADHFARHRVRA